MAEEEAVRRGVRVSAVHLKLGALAGVVKDALIFSYEIACQGTTLEGSRLCIEDIPVVAYCPKCLGLRKIESVQWFVCSECKSPVSDVVEGRELQVAALEILELEHASATAISGS